MSSIPLIAIVLVCATTLLVGTFGLRWSRHTSDFYVAGRTVSPGRNASAISGEYLSAASFLGVAGLIYDQGFDMLWLPVGYTVGYIVLLVLIAAPLRRSGAYTLPDFAEARMESRTIRTLAALLVIGIGWLYLVPQFQGAGLALAHVTGAPLWVGGLVVAVVVVLNVAAGGMRSITLVQAMQYWLKLAAIAVPAFVLLALWWRQGGPPPQLPDDAWARPNASTTTAHPLYLTWSTLLALALGTMGLPHVLVRFYTNPDGRDARRTIVVVVALLGLFYLFPPLYALLGRAYLSRLPDGVSPDNIVLNLPGAITDGLLADVLSAIVAGGAFAAFLSTASGLVMSVSGVLHHDLLRRRLARLTGEDAGSIHGFRVATIVAVILPYALSRLLQPLGLATTVVLAFAVSAATFAPLLTLGVWWRGLSTIGAIAGLITGGMCALGAIITTMLIGPLDGWSAALLGQPAAWCIPLAFAVSIVVSLATPRHIPPHTALTLVRLHTPEAASTAAEPRPSAESRATSTPRPRGNRGATV